MKGEGYTKTLSYNYDSKISRKHFIFVFRISVFYEIRKEEMNLQMKWIISRNQVQENVTSQFKIVWLIRVRVNSYEEWYANQINQAAFPIQTNALINILSFQRIFVKYTEWLRWYTDTTEEKVIRDSTNVIESVTNFF